jgi:hypothetical protein
VTLVLDWPAWGLTWLLPLLAISYAALLLAYVRALPSLPGVNPFSMPPDAASRPYYVVCLAVAAALLLSPIAHLFRPSWRMRVGLGAGAAVAIVLALFLAQKIRRPGILGWVLSGGAGPLSIAEKAEALI